jgi:hypothetical protein
MRLNILCQDHLVNESREIAKQITKEPVLKIPTSPTGKMPVTHWFCSLETNDEGFDRIIGLKKNSVIECGNPKQFLDKWGLKIIR